MENITLGFVLFCIYFCSVSCFMYSGKSESNSTEIQIQEPIETQIQEMFRMIDEDDAFELIEDDPDQETVIKEITDQELIEALNLDKLPILKARPVAKALDIRQKVKGKDVSVKLLRVQIKQRLKEKPELLPLVYDILEISFPLADHIDTLST